MYTGNFKFDRKSKIPLHRQICNFIIGEIKAGHFENNEKLPSRRKLSQLLGASGTTVDLAYQLLASEGYVYSKDRSGFYVRLTNNITFDTKEFYWEESIKYVYNFSQNGQCLDFIPRRKFSKLLQTAVYNEDDIFDHGGKSGDLYARRAVAKHLYNSRGIPCSPEQIVIGAGEDYLFRLIGETFPKDMVWAFENPGNMRFYTALNNLGRKSEFVNVTTDGFDFDAFVKLKANILVVSPSHQFPLGYQMDLKTREKLLKWVASAPDRCIIEYDYDGDLIYNSDEPPLMSALDKSGRVIYMNSFTRCIAPAIKMAYLMIPEKIMQLWIDSHLWQRRVVQFASLASRLEQYVIAELIDSGALSRCILSLQREYKKRQKVLIDALNSASFADKVSIGGCCGGTHVIMTVNMNRDVLELRRRAANAGVKIVPVTVYTYGTSHSIDPHIFVAGFGALNEEEIRDGVKLLDKAWGNLENE